MKKIIFILFTLTFILTGCVNTDVVRTYSEKSLEQIVTNFKEIVKDEDNRYILTSDDSNSLIVRKNYSESEEDIIMELDAAPFINAGMSETNIPNNYRVENNKLIIPTDFGKGESNSFLEAFFLSADNQRNKLSYHKELDHYGVELYYGNKFEFAKDCKTNDKDIVFVLAVEPLKELNIDVKNIEGWTFKTIRQTNGTEVDVIVKAYDMEM